MLNYGLNGEWTLCHRWLKKVLLWYLMKLIVFPDGA